jgi:group II intron reverse transcriptase/maturase
MNENQKKVEVEQQAAPQKHKRDLTAAERVGILQEKLYCKAKQERDYKFYILYDKVFIPYMLRAAYQKVKAKNGAPGIDGMSFADIEEYGRELFLSELGDDLRRRVYKPQAVKRVWLDKPDGGKRPLGIPTIRDRVAQMVCKMLIEPIFEADFEDSSYGFRPNRSATDAMKVIKAHLEDGKTEILDADLSSYFDTIPHEKLMKVLSMRIADKRLLHLIGLWLKSPVFEDGQFKGGKKRKTGTPQGGVISPLLANIYLHLVDRLVNKKNGTFERAGIRIVRYADDFVLLGRKLTDDAMELLRSVLVRMELTLNEQKTRRLQAKDTAFDFLGFTVRYDRDFHKRKDRRYWNIVPSAKSEKKVRGKVREFLRRGGHFAPKRVADGLNTILRGWLNYFDVPKVSYPAMSRRRLRHYLLNSLDRYYNRKSQRRSRLHGTQAYDLLVSQYGLIDPTKHRA